MVASPCDGGPLPIVSRVSSSVSCRRQPTTPAEWSGAAERPAPCIRIGSGSTLPPRPQCSQPPVASRGASEKEAFLDFRVTLQPIDKRTKMKTQAAPMVFAERSRFRKVGDAWLYASGEVTSEEAGLKGAVLNGQRDLTKLEKDVEYVKGVLGEDSPFK